MTWNVGAVRARLPVARPLVASGTWRLVGFSAIAGGAYYAGAAIGLTLKLPAAITSVLWPPNAILTAALLLTPRRLWPVALLSALPAHVALELGAGWPMTLVLALFATNCSEALLAAGGLRWMSDAPTRFDSLRRVTAFLGVVAIAAPFVTSFLDAAAVSWIRGEAYWQVWTARLVSNSLTALTVVPALVMVVTSGRNWVKTAPRSQHVEATLLAASMFLVAVVLLRTPAPDSMTATLAERAPLALLLPFLLWAAIRLGPGGVSLALLGSALLLVGAALRSHGPFLGLSPSDTTMALQLLLIALSFPLLVVAALVEERRLAQQDVSSRLAMEALLARLSGAFVQLPSNRMRHVFSESLRQIGEFLALECLILLEPVDPAGEPALVASWTAAGSEDVPGIVLRHGLPWPMERLRRHEAVALEGMRRGWTLCDGGRFQRGFESSLAIPLIAEEKFLGVLACTSAASIAARHPPLEGQLQSIARVLANALARRRTEDALRASEAMKSAILSSLTNGVVVLDRQGCIITVNDRWCQMVGEGVPSTATEVGARYLEFYRAAARSGELGAAEAAAGIESVLIGTSTDFRVEHVRPGPDGDRTIVIRAVPLDRPEGGAVVTHVDLTDQRRAVLEAQRARAEVAHVSRVATMGALTASIAHQLNQPLTGIQMNAQAARRFLAGSPPDLDEARASIEDIVEDNRRASEVIVRMRELLRKGDSLIAEIDLNAVVSDVAHLVSSDAIIRNVALVLQLDEEPALVRGDRVQLQQVVLNLIVNALEAFGDRRSSDRWVAVRSTRSDRRFVEISVIDNGAGFNGSQASAFESFYTTKPDGMGLGLSIARSIVEAHAGVIRAANNPDGGATVCFRLPLAGQGDA